MVNEKKVFGRTKQQFMAQMLCAYQGIAGAEAIDSVNKWESWFDKHASDKEMSTAPTPPDKSMMETRADCDNCRDGARGGCGNCSFLYTPQDVPEPDYYEADLCEVAARVLADVREALRASFAERHKHLSHDFNVSRAAMILDEQATLLATPGYVAGLVADL